MKVQLSGGDDRNLMERLLEKQIPLANSCNGKGTCGKCKVKVVSGTITDVTDTERRLLTEKEVAGRMRLACMTKARGEVVIETGEVEEDHVFTTGGVEGHFKRDADKHGYGLAVDIGTTTVVATLVCLDDGTERATYAQINPQKTYGLDVLTRITYETEHKEAAISQLQKAIVQGLNEAATAVCNEAGIEVTEITEIDVAANCTMLHMLAGVDARPIGRAPYKPAFTDGQKLKARDLGLMGAAGAMVYLLPSVSAYIGADIVAGVYVCDLRHSPGKTLFIDIGTNGELVLEAGGNMYSCSCAAGPALEGMNITSGMRAAKGAVEDVHIGPDGIRLDVIGKGKPHGLCGSGILAVVRELVRTGLVTRRGAFARPEDFEVGDYRRDILRYNGTKREALLYSSGETELLVTQSDVRQVQLAKGAIRSGIEVLLSHGGLTYEDIDKVLIAGQFGAHLPAESLLQIGLLPPVTEDKLAYAGNSAKSGAVAALLSDKVKEDMEDLAKHIHYIELGSSDNYERLFAKCLLF